MALNRLAMKPTWSPDLSDYDYLLDLAYPGWRWEFVRRSLTYALAAQTYGYAATWVHPGAPSVRMSRSSKRCRPAEQWNLDCFRRPFATRAKRARDLDF
jgi:hypothetical protein